MSCINCGAPTDYTLCGTCSRIYKNRPCINCGMREPHCHMTCRMYKRWLHVYHAIVKYEREQKKQRGRY